MSMLAYPSEASSTWRPVMASSAVENEGLLVAENRKIKTFAKCHARNIFLQLKRQTFEFKINKYNNSNDATTTTMTENEEKIDLRFQCQARNKFFYDQSVKFSVQRASPKIDLFCFR